MWVNLRRTPQPQRRRLLIESLEGRRLLTTIDLAALTAAQGSTIFGANADDRSGFLVSSAEDVNGDGFDDLLIGARRADAAGNAKTDAGDSYLIFGGKGFINSIPPANLGTSAANTITGTSAAQVLNGADGDDTLVGGGGADILLGGRDNDILAVSDLTFKRLVGGNGNDTLRLDGSGLHLNLTTIRDNRIVDIESINITGSGNNTLTLNQREVLNLSSHSNTLVVRRNDGDVVNIGTGWTQGADMLIGPDKFAVYNQGAAKLLIQASMDFGDAPAPYPTLLAANGARHTAVGPRLGLLRDVEPNGSPSTLADGDGSDEDGVMFGAIGLNASMAAVNINLQNAATAKVDAWVDFNRNNIWEPSEQILTSATVSGGMQTLNFTVPASGVVAGVTFARVRVSTAGGLQPTGAAANGEVEDYRVNLFPAVPQVETVTINGGAATRSKVTSLTVTFDSVVDHASLNSAFTVRNITTNTQVGAVNVAATNTAGKTTAVLTFSGASTLSPVNAALGKTLLDGNYRLDILASQVKLVANNAATMPVNYVFGNQLKAAPNNDNFFRWYGDDNGDGFTDFNDFATGFLPAFGTTSGNAGYNESLDANGDNFVDFTDFASAFLPKFGTTRP